MSRHRYPGSSWGAAVDYSDAVAILVGHICEVCHRVSRDARRKVPNLQKGYDGVRVAINYGDTATGAIYNVDSVRLGVQVNGVRERADWHLS